VSLVLYLTIVNDNSSKSCRLSSTLVVIVDQTLACPLELGERRISAVDCIQRFDLLAFKLKLGGLKFGTHMRSVNIHHQPNSSLTSSNLHGETASSSEWRPSKVFQEVKNDTHVSIAQLVSNQKSESSR
jgi:hypothetical protein